jgi:hypothetical protein
MIDLDDGGREKRAAAARRRQDGWFSILALAICSTPPGILRRKSGDVGPPTCGTREYPPAVRICLEAKIAVCCAAGASPIEADSVDPGSITTQTDAFKVKKVI